MSSTETLADVIVIGGGIAGVSIAYELSKAVRVTVLEMESALAYHTTGRSAATFLETYGGVQVRALTTASRAFFEEPPELFEPVLMTPRPLLQFASAGRGHVVTRMREATLALVPDVELLDGAQCCEVFPLLRPDAAECGIYEPRAMALDVAAIHQGYVRGARSNGTTIFRSAEVVTMERGGSDWTVATSDGRRHQAPTVVNAAGAWADVVAATAGVRRVGLTPLLRTIFMVASPMGERSKGLPACSEVDQAFYANPEGAQFLCSPADETPCPPCDAKPDSLEIARAIDAINAATTIGARSVTASWGGLRSFAPDREFVVGADPDASGFYWLAGQGGYGIQTAPAAARLGAALVLGEPVPPDLVARGLDAARLAPHSAGRVSET
jgi:D-arginine dehydrogenase